MKAVKHIAIGSMFLALLSGTPTYAQSSRDAKGDVALRVQNAIRQLTQERDAARAENIGLQDQIKKLTSDLDAAKKVSSTLKVSAGEADAKKNALLDRYKETDAALRERVAQQNEKMQQLVDKYKELVGSLRAVEQQRAESQQMVVSQARELDRCVENNVQLFNTGSEVLDRYQHKGVWEALRQSEPVTQIARVKLENAVQDYRGRLLDAKARVATELIDPQQSVADLRNGDW